MNKKTDRTADNLTQNALLAAPNPRTPGEIDGVRQVCANAVVTRSYTPFYENNPELELTELLDMLGVLHVEEYKLQKMRGVGK